MKPVVALEPDCKVLMGKCRIGDADEFKVAALEHSAVVARAPEPNGAVIADWPGMVALRGQLETEALKHHTGTVQVGRRQP